MQFVKTDGGMRSSGFAEHNDCAVRAYALFKDIPYDEAHRTFKQRGRRDGHATKNHIIYELLGRDTRKDGEKITLNQLIAKFPRGRVYGLKRGHAFAIIDGVLHDSWKVGGKSRTNFYWVDNSTPSAETALLTSFLRTYAPTPAKQYSVESPADKQASARLTFDRLNAYGTLSNYAIAKRIAEEINISVANAQYYVAKFTGKR